MLCKRILFLGASRYQRNSIGHLRQYGYEVFAIDRNPDADGFRSANGFGVVDIKNEKKALSYVVKNRINGILAVNDFGVRTAAYISERLKLPGLGYETAKIATDKALMRAKWAEKEVPIPEFFITMSLDEARKKAKSMQFPLILKPAESRGGGSRGVKVIFDIKELEEAFDFAQTPYRDKRVIIEQCVEGTEHSVEVAMVGGKPHILAVSDKEKTPYPYRVDRKVFYPAELQRTKLEELKGAVKKAVAALDIMNGVAHVELAITEKGPVLFEIGARCGGGATPQIVEGYTGIPYLKIAAQIALGERIDSRELIPKYKKAALYSFFTFKPGRVKKIMGAERLKEFKEVVDFEIFLKSGDTVNEVRSGADRHGFAVIISKDKPSLMNVSREVDKRVYCEYEKVEAE